MDRRQIRETIDRAVEAMIGSVMARTDARRDRKAWGAWRAQWAALERLPPDQRMLTVCMYCERFRVDTGEWVAATAGLAGVLHDPKVIQVSHGACPICVAGRLGDPPE